MKKVMLGFLLVGAFLAATCTQSGTLPATPNAPTGSINAQGGGNSPDSATIQFGNDGVGSHFPPPSGHDASGNARDNLIPRTVVIDKGGTVTFKMGFSGVHQVAIYSPGTDPDSIRTTAPFLTSGGRGCPPVPLINDPQNRVAVVGTQACSGGSSTLTFTFKTAGKFLVICTFLPHFQTGMYGWVEVRDR
jgi:plastocyanin